MKKGLSDVVLANAVALDNATKYSDSVEFCRCTGYAGMILTNGAAGTITITQQASPNNKDWYSCVDQNNSAIGQVAVITTSAETRYIQFDPVIAKYIRFKMVEGGALATTVTIRLIYQE